MHGELHEFANDASRVARVDDLFDAETLGGA